MVAAPRRSALLALLAPEHPGGSQQAILAELRRVILSGDVPPGTPIPLDEVAEQFGVSRIPVREALKTLVGESLVDHRPRSGYAVARLTRAEFAELYLVRGVLESAALAAAVGRAGPADDAAAQAALRAMDRAIGADDVRSYHRESRVFHLALIRPAHMLRLQTMLESAWNMTEPFRPMTLLSGAQRTHLHAEHAEMFTAFVARDRAALLEISGRHMQGLETVLADLPDDTGPFDRPPDSKPAPGMLAGPPHPDPTPEDDPMSAPTPPVMSLAEFNSADPATVRELLTACLDVPSWVDAVAAGRPYPDRVALDASATGRTALITWEEAAAALARHPRIGERAGGSGVDAAWSGNEQSGVQAGQIDDLAAGNAAYEERFGHIFLISAAGRSGDEILTALRERLTHTPEEERDVVLGELGQIGALRLDKAVGA
ncbi:OHCU decarboxylase [Nakamurella flavida]|nr:2-oxo-4-hydroxy-4-carboxy-5-ureidoimidazoline decarboxylase [Nakamurella flavida]MDP9779358.1 OHCU decarboxylase [Nakamurella flavida]